MATLLNITGPTVVKATGGTISGVSVVVAGTGAGSVNDSSTTGGASSANAIAPLPAAVGWYPYEWTTVNGIVVLPGSGQTIAIQYF